MSRPIYEPSLPRADAVLGYGSRQLFRRPAPIAGAECVYPCPVWWGEAIRGSVQTIPTGIAAWTYVEFTNWNIAGGQTAVDAYNLGGPGANTGLSFPVDVGEDGGGMWLFQGFVQFSGDFPELRRIRIEKLSGTESPSVWQEDRQGGSAVNLSGPVMIPNAHTPTDFVLGVMQDTGTDKDITQALLRAVLLGTY